MNARSNLERVLAAGHFADTAELGPPKTAAPAFIKKRCGMLADCADAVNLTDNQTAVVRLSSIAAAAVVHGEGLEPVVQMTCRDRNRIAIQSDLIGAYALGVRNVLCLTGDHMCLGNHPMARPVFDLDSIQLVQMVKGLGEGRLQCGEVMKTKKPPRFYVGAASNPFGDPYEFRFIRLAKKIEAGADFIQTQSIFDLPKFKDFMTRATEMGLTEKVRILAGVMPVKSHKALEYMDRDVPGIRIPPEHIKRMKQAEDPKEEGVRMCLDFIAEVKEYPGVAGVHIMAMAWEDVVERIVAQAGLMPRPRPGEEDTEAKAPSAAPAGEAEKKPEAASS